MKNSIQINKRLYEHYKTVEKLGLEIVGVFLQGSQNYGLDYEQSDIDTKCIILPSFNCFCANKQPISKTIILENDEHIDVKDIRLMFSNFKKQNINFVEILFTKYFIINKKYAYFWNILLKHNEEIARYDIYKSIDCICGMSMQKLKALKHPYPSIIDKIKKFGYDPKQLHHIYRLNYFIKDYISGKPYYKCLLSQQKDFMIEVKKGLIHSEEEAEIEAKELDNETKAIAKEYKETNDNIINKNVENILDSIIVDIIKIYFKECVK